jgi:glycosyltransferase involved in cell wall biosynthesis
MASGAAPLITGWEGSDAIYSPEWIFEDTHSMAKFIRRANENDQWLGLASQAKGQVIKTFGLQTVLGEWRALIEEQADALGRQ